jgi:hypothetical protein
MIETLSLLIHADAKIGKTTLAATSPVPILVIDAEGGWKFLPIRMTEWNPMDGPPPLYDGTWDACHVTLRTWEELLQIYQWLDYGQHNFRSVVLDSITELQRKLKSNLRGEEVMRIQDWGDLLVKMDTKITGFRDLTLHPRNPVQVVVFIAESRANSKGKMIPSMQGQISTSLPYRVDVVGYLFTQDLPNDAGQYDGTNKVRRLLVSPNDQFEAGERVQGRLGMCVDYPNITNMLIQVYPSLQQQQV